MAAPPPALTLVDGMSGAKLVLTETPPPQLAHSIPLRAGPSPRGGKRALAAARACVHVRVRDGRNAGSASKFIWPRPQVCQSVQANLAERRCRNTNQQSSKGS